MPNRFAAAQQGGIEGQEIVTADRAGRPIRHRFEAEASGPFGEDLAEPWVDQEALLRRYRRIYLSYRLFGDRSILARTGPGRRAREALSKVLRRPLPGWFDTHAKHSRES